MKRAYYFIGIGGIGMSAIARYLMHEGCAVGGYDRTESALCDELAAEGADIHYEDSVDLIGPQFRDPASTSVIYTPAVPADHSELCWFRENGFSVVKRSRALGILSEGKYVMAVAGTHGKTTTSTLVAWLNRCVTGGGSAFLGGISKNFHNNLVLGSGDRLAVEADEFDRSFLQLFPHIAVITSTDADHLDIYSDHGHVLEAFGLFAGQVDADGFVVLKQGVELPQEGIRAKVLRYAYDTPCDFYASDIVALPGGRFDFTLNHPDGRIEHCCVGIPGWVNVENAVAAAAAALLHGIAPEQIRAALACFQGVRRRFDIHLDTPRIAYIDDYAHHPNEIRAAISSIRNIFPGRKLLGIFQPHLYTRTRDFAADFADALGGLDALVLLPIYPAREEPIPGVSASLIFDQVRIDDKTLIPKEQLMDFLHTRTLDCVVTFGAGDIDRFIGPVETYLKTLL